MKVSVVGLGKLGACTAACFAAKGHEVLGVDVNRSFVDAVNEGRAPVLEPGLEEMIELGHARLRATTEAARAISETDVTLLILPTPSLPSGEFSNAFLESSLKDLGEALAKSSKPYHLFVVTSTTSPGSCDEVIVPLLERGSGRKLNEGFGVCYNPEFIALGSVITDFLKPDLLLIGESNAAAGDTLVELYKPVHENAPQVARMSLVSAEITKISLNAYVTMKISFANGLMNICDRIPGADVDAITRALGADKRISPRYLRGALAFGGPCFPRDNRAFVAFATRQGCEAHLAKATDAVNHEQTERLAEKIGSLLGSARKTPVAVLGLTYKANTPVLEESPAVSIVKALLRREHEVVVYDPLAIPQAKVLFGRSVAYADSARACFESSALCVIATDAAEFRQIDSSYIRLPTTIIDCWRILDPKKLGASVTHVILGRCERIGAPV